MPMNPTPLHPDAGPADDLPVDAVLAQVERFCSADLAAAVAQHESALELPRLQRLRDTLTEIGVLGAADEPGCGLALWEAAATPRGRALSLAVLSALSRHSIGVAWHLHQLALTQHLERRLALRSGLRAVAVLQGHHGLAAGAVASWIAGHDLDAEHRALLRDHYDAARPPGLLLHTGGDWDAAWLPAVDADGALHWQCWRRDQLEVREQAHAHGLDELVLYSLMRRAHGTPLCASALAAPAARRLAAELLSLNALAQLAAALGGVQHARRLAQDYAQLRHQGGKRIAAHAAVQLLLGTSADAAMMASAALERLSGPDPADPATLAALFRARAVLHPLCCRATSDALQVFGGLGYMRDTGLEKILRDQNTLRVIHGSPVELQLAAHRLEESEP